MSQLTGKRVKGRKPVPIEIGEKKYGDDFFEDGESWMTVKDPRYYTVLDSLINSRNTDAHGKEIIITQDSFNQFEIDRFGNRGASTWENFMTVNRMMVKNLKMLVLW